MFCLQIIRHILLSFSTIIPEVFSLLKLHILYASCIFSMDLAGVSADLRKTMDYYSSNYYNTDLAGYENSTPYSPDYYDYAPIYEYEEPKFVTWSEPTYYQQYPNQSEISYSVSSVSQPKFVQYDLNGDVGYNISNTHYVISYSTMEFNEDVEYDPTPYGGGYDPAQTYGEPLPPSDKICYPNSNIPKSPSGSLALTHGNEIHYEIEPAEENEAQNEIQNSIEEEEVADDDDDDDEEEEEENDFETQAELPTALPQSQEKEGIFIENQYPWTDYGFPNGGIENYGYENEKQICQTEAPYGYGPSSDTVGFCESLFGYWPCLSRKDNGSCNDRRVEDEDRNLNRWNGIADQFFGSSNKYGYGRDEEASHVRTIYGYERHYPEEVQHRQIEYNESSWLQEFYRY